MSIIYVVLASLLAATVNFCLRKNMEQQKSSSGYLTLYFISSFIISFFVTQITLKSLHFVMPSIGAIAGILSFVMMALLARSLQLGASGLTFAFQNSASVFPAFLLFFIFGTSFGYNLNSYVLIGFTFIIAGLFLSARVQKVSFLQRPSFVKWCALVIAIFLLQGIILSLFEWRCLLMSEHAGNYILIPWKCSAEEDAWFMPGFFFVPAILQAIIFAVSEKRWFARREFLLGVTAGLLNGGSTFLLLLATKYSADNEKMILFPLFAVSVIFLCHLWGKALYREPIYWPGMLCCLSGVFIGSIGG